MGVKYSSQESQELIQAMTNNLQVANEVTDRLSSGISSLDSGELSGAAYTAGKGLFTDIIIPSIKKLQAAIDDIQLRDCVNLIWCDNMFNGSMLEHLGSDPHYFKNCRKLTNAAKTATNTSSATPYLKPYNAAPPKICSGRASPKAYWRQKA